MYQPLHLQNSRFVGPWFTREQDFPFSWCLSFARQPCKSMPRSSSSEHPALPGTELSWDLGTEFQEGPSWVWGGRECGEMALLPAGEAEWTLGLSSTLPVPEACFPRAHISVVISNPLFSCSSISPQDLIITAVLS